MLHTTLRTPLIRSTLENVDKSAERDELLALQQRLESKIQVRALVHLFEDA